MGIRERVASFRRRFIERLVEGSVGLSKTSEMDRLNDAMLSKGSVR